ncbi:MAG: sulfurtransferase [Deltaproteobacteria bacterium]|nr:sulfurtransferase [Deltaproteobacteria bacterium]
MNPLVSTTWVEENLERIVTLDASWYLPKQARDARAEFLRAHVPGSRFFDLDAASDQSSPLPHTLPSAEAFGAYVGRLGVSNDSTVVVYDGSGTNLSAARVWWMFRTFGHREVFVLDGGFGRWLAEHRQTEPGAVSPDPASYVARLDERAVRTIEEVERALLSHSARVVDLRSAGRFSGTEPEPRPGLPSGHMAGSLNLPFNELVHGDGTVLSEPELRERLSAAGIDLSSPVIATCGSGTSACNLLLALERLSFEDYALYDGSWTEWAQSGRPRQQLGAF